jgi:cell fate (sporulation/competence/biofilm development) regulator YlbF (YheA/YmcA/DUF963 family)
MVMNYETMLNMLMQGLKQNVRNNNNINSLKKQSLLMNEIMDNVNEIIDNRIYELEGQQND